jgi:hypothetical protein
MSKVKIQGNASGTGVLTVTAPNTSTDRTITLPDATGTLATTADVPAGISSSADATAITIDSNENVGIGHPLNTHTQKLVIKKNATVDNLAEGALINLVNEQGAGNTAALRFTGVNQNAYLGYFDGTTSTARRLSIGVGANAEQFSFTSNGLTFNGDTAAANALDDYEEGSFTPVFTGSGGSTGSYNTGEHEARYTKVGRLVTIHWKLTLTNKGSWSGEVRFTGLPFTPAFTLNGAGSIELGNVNYTGDSVGNVNTYITASQTYWRPRYTKDNEAAVMVQVSEVDNDAFFGGTLSYIVA